MTLTDTPQEQQYSDASYDDAQMYDYGNDSHGQYGSHSTGYVNGSNNPYGAGYYNYGHSTFGDDVQLDDDDDNDMW